MVTASRFGPGSSIEMTRLKKWGNRRVARLLSLLTGTQIADASCGFRAYTRWAFLELTPIGDFTYTHETILTLAFKDFRIQEVTVPVLGTRPSGRSRVARSLPRYAFHSLLIILRCYRDYRPMVLFGLPSAVISIVGFLLLVLFGVVSLVTGEFFPKSAAFSGAFCLGLGALLFVVALLADMFTRLRVQIENLSRLIDEHRKPEP